MQGVQHVVWFVCFNLNIAVTCKWIRIFFCMCFLALACYRWSTTHAKKRPCSPRGKVKTVEICCHSEAMVSSPTQTVGWFLSSSGLSESKSLQVAICFFHLDARPRLFSLICIVLHVTSYFQMIANSKWKWIYLLPSTSIDPNISEYVPSIFLYKTHPGCLTPLQGLDLRTISCWEYLGFRSSEISRLDHLEL